jgi:hypothetical protein
MGLMDIVILENVHFHNWFSLVIVHDCTLHVFRIFDLNHFFMIIDLHIFVLHEIAFIL